MFFAMILPPTAWCGLRCPPVLGSWCHHVPVRPGFWRDSSQHPL